MSKKTTFCPKCKSDEIIQEKVSQNLNVKGENIEVPAEILICKNCKLEFENMDDDYFDTAYRIYRQKHGLLQPEEIKEIRKRYELSQKEFSEIIGIGPATLNRYENGALQNVSHNNLLRLIRNPITFLEMLKKRDFCLDESKVKKLQEQLKKECKIDKAIETCLDVEYQPSVYSGNRRFNPKKFEELITFMCDKRPVFRTVLNKLPFYADFLHYRRYNESITGTRYARIDFGPVPDFYRDFYYILTKEGKIREEEEVFESGITGIKYVANKQPDLSVFTDEELATISAVKAYFKEYGAKKISELSHEEDGYKETNPNEFISYEFAKSLKVNI
jgi:putative zinc finger/helix-turn-helix YgiT family protein